MTTFDPPGECTCDALPAGHTDDECAANQWARYTRAFPGPCVCSHPESLHYRDRKGRPTCGVAVCACTSFREAVDCHTPRPSSPGQTADRMGDGHQ